MKDLFLKYTKFMLLGVLFMLALNSCIIDREAYDDPEPPGGSIRLLLNIKAIAAANSNQDTQLTEAVKSLRVIIITPEGIIEANDLVNLQDDSYISSSFEYTYTTSLSLGNKRIYLVANEESVTKVELTDRTGLPDELPAGGDLSSLLSYFKRETEKSSTHNGPIFEKVLNRAYFNADYSQAVSGNNIYLPYSAYYEIGPEELGASRLEHPLYLVPAATKVEFKLTNYRRYYVTFQDILFCSVNSSNYLNAMLDASEQKKTLNGQQVWWIDWMEACARGSQSASDLEDFNDTWGWFKTYQMPLTETMVQKSLNPRNDDWTLEAMVDKTNPDKLNLGPFYLPESRNLADPLTLIQNYTLTFKIHDGNGENDIVLEGYEIDTLKTLFRGTHTIIYIDIYEQAMEIYAEIVPWTFQPFWGYVQQEEDD